MITKNKIATIRKIKNSDAVICRIYNFCKSMSFFKNRSEVYNSRDMTEDKMRIYVDFDISCKILYIRSGYFLKRICIKKYRIVWKIKSAATDHI